jgi:hypothetical protein
MKWFIKWLLLVWGTLCLICTAVVVLSRLDHAPSALQLYGIDLCDGEPCFQGLKVGTDWTKVQDLFPEAINKQLIELPSNVTGLAHAAIFASEDMTSLEGISVYSMFPDDPPLPFKAGDVIAQFGSPCRIYLWYSDEFPANMILVYPRMTVRTDPILGDGIANALDFRLQLDSPVSVLRIAAKNNSYGSCSDVVLNVFGPWRGFTAADIYLHRNLREMEVAPPTN